MSVWLILIKGLELEFILPLNFMSITKIVALLVLIALSMGLKYRKMDAAS